MTRARARSSTDTGFLMKRNSLFNCHSEHRVIEIRRHYYVYFLLADLVANLVSNYMALLAMDACGKDGYINIPPTPPVISTRTEDPDLGIGVNPVNCGSNCVLLVIAESHALIVTPRSSRCQTNRVLRLSPLVVPSGMRSSNAAAGKHATDRL